MLHVEKNGKAWEAKSCAHDCAITVLYFCTAIFYTFLYISDCTIVCTWFCLPGPPVFQCATLKIWEWRGDEATYPLSTPAVVVAKPGGNIIVLVLTNRNMPADQMQDTSFDSFSVYRIPYSRKFWSEKTSTNFADLMPFVKVFSSK